MYNVEYANIKGLETILEYNNNIFSGKISYTLFWAKGTSSYAGEYTDTLLSKPNMDYYLDFDQRHRFFIQGGITGPVGTNIFLLAYLGNGFPYTPPGYLGKYEERNIFHLPFQKQIDCVIMKNFKVNILALTVQLEIINLLDQRYELAPHYPLMPIDNIRADDFTDYIPITNPYYSPASDLNHDGIITPYENFYSFREMIIATDDWVAAYSAPRRARLGFTINLW